MEMKPMDIYDVMEEKLAIDIRSIKIIRRLGKEIISKMKLIDDEINIINPDHIQWKEMLESDRNKLSALYSLKSQYRNQFDIITIVLNKDNRVVSNFTKDKFKEMGLDDKFIVADLEGDIEK